MASETGRWVFARIHNELPAAPACGDMFAPWPVAGFAPAQAFQLRPFKIEARVRTGWKNASDVRVTLVTGLVPGISCALDQRRSDDGPVQTGAGQETETTQTRRGKNRDPARSEFHKLPSLGRVLVIARPTDLRSHGLCMARRVAG